MKTYLTFHWYRIVLLLARRVEAEQCWRDCTGNLLALGWCLPIIQCWQRSMTHHTRDQHASEQWPGSSLPRQTVEGPDDVKDQKQVLVFMPPLFPMTPEQFATMWFIQDVSALRGREPKATILKQIQQLKECRVLKREENLLPRSFTQNFNHVSKTFR